MLEPDPPRNTARQSPYRGVSWHRLNRRWRAKIFSHGRDINLGYYDDPEIAAKVYDAAAARLCCDESVYNFDGCPPKEVPLEEIYRRLRDAGVI